MAQFEVRNDAGPSPFLTRELDFVLAELVRDDLSLMKILDKIPINTKVDPRAANVRFVTLTQVGSAVILRGPSDEIPRADFFRQENVSPIKTFWTSFGYTLEELENAEFANVPLEREGMESAKEAMARAINECALNGNAANQLPGLFTNPNIPRFTVAGGVWAGKTGPQIVTDLDAMVTRVMVQSRGRYSLTEILLPLEQYRLAATITMFTGIELTALEYFKRNNPGVSVDWINELDAAGTGGVDMAVGYVNDNRVFEYIQPLLFQPIPKQDQSLGIEVRCREKSGGTLVKRPLGLVIAEGI